MMRFVNIVIAAALAVDAVLVPDEKTLFDEQKVFQFVANDNLSHAFVIGFGTGLKTYSVVVHDLERDQWSLENLPEQKIKANNDLDRLTLLDALAAPTQVKSRMPQLSPFRPKETRHVAKQNGESIISVADATMAGAFPRGTVLRSANGDEILVVTGMSKSASGPAGHVVYSLINQNEIYTEQPIVISKRSDELTGYTAHDNVADLLPGQADGQPLADRSLASISPNGRKTSLVRALAKKGNGTEE